MTRLGATVIRYRYLLLGAWLAAWAVPLYERNAGKLGDYYVLAFGGRALTGNMPHYSGPLHLYATHPDIQVGPPALLIIGGFIRLTTTYDQALTGILIALCGLVAVRCVEVAAVRLGVPARKAALGTLTGGAVVLAGWAYIEVFYHLDDALAVMLLAAAVAAVASRRPWLAAVLLGCATATKPWMVMTLPLLLGLPRPNRAKAIGVAVAAAAVWWLPFLIGAPDTAGALAGLGEPIGSTSVLWALGAKSTPPFLHAAMFVVGLGFASLAALRGRWVAVPFTALAARALLEPRVLPYYVVGTLVAALLVDLHSHQRVPVWTLATAAVQIVAPFVFLDWRSGVLTLAFVAVVVARFVLRHADRCTYSPGELFTDGAPVFIHEHPIDVPCKRKAPSGVQVFYRSGRLNLDRDRPPAAAVDRPARLRAATADVDAVR